MQNQPPLSENDIPQLLHLLKTALSPDASVQKQAEAVLASLETRLGYCSCLAAVVGNQEADHSARWLAAVQLKNNVNKYWRPRYNSGGLSHEEKNYLRGQFLQLIPQDDNQIAVQVALLVSKAARFDFPQQWPGLFNDLLAGIAAPTAAAGGGPSLLAVRRTYFVLHHVLKELSSKRLAADQKAFAEVTKLLFDHVWGSWGSLLSDILAALPAALAAPGTAAPPGLLLAFERWLLLLKIVRRLLLFGFPSDAKSLQEVPAVTLVAPQLLAAVSALQAARHGSEGGAGSGGGASVGRSQLSAMVERGMLKLIKTLSQVQHEHPWTFHHAGVLLPTLETCYNQLLAAAGGGGTFPPAREALLMTCCRCIQGVLQCEGYTGRVGSGAGGGTERAATIKAMSVDVSGQLSGWWAAPGQLPHLPALAAAHASLEGVQQQQQQQHSRQAVLLQVLIAGFFPLTLRDLEEWQDDAETWAHANADTAGTGECLRSCCHQLALSLLLANKDALAPVLVQLLQQVSRVVPPGWGVGPYQQQQQQQQQQQHGQAGVWPGLPGPAVSAAGGVAYPALLLLKEAVYEAVGLAAYELHDYIDYQGWLKGSLLPEMMAVNHAQQQPGISGSSRRQQQRLLPILPRAAARLVGRWVADLKNEDRPAAYTALTMLLVQPGTQQQQQRAGSSSQAGGAEPDVVLQLSAVSAMRTLVDDFGFEAEGFVGVLPAVVGALTGMLRASEELDTQNQVFGLLNLIIDRLGSDITPHVGGIMPLLPQTWAAAEDQSLLRIQVLCCLSLLVNVLGGDSPTTYPLLLPLLHQALDPASNQPELLEDALGLWLVALRNAPGVLGGAEGAATAGVGGLLELAPELTACLTTSTEHITLGMQLLSSLLLLGGGPFLASYGPQLLGVCAAYVGQVVERGLLLMLPPLDLLLVAAPQQAAPLMQPFMQRLLGLLLSGEESGLLVANALALFARLLLQHPAAFEQLLGACAAAGVTAGPAAAAAAGVQEQQQQQGGSVRISSAEGLLLALVGCWCDAFDSIAQPLARKLAACGLAALLGLPVKALLHQLPLMLSHISSVWLELESSGADDAASERSWLVYGDGLWSSGTGWDDDGGLLVGQSLTASEEAEGEAARRQALRDAEPLRNMRISRLLADKLAAAAALHGPHLAAAMAALDPAIAQQVQAVLAAAGAGQQQ